MAHLCFYVVGTARVIRADRGTENLNIAALQRFYRLHDRDSMAALKSFLYGRSTANQVDRFPNKSLKDNVLCHNFLFLHSRRKRKINKVIFV